MLLSFGFCGVFGICPMGFSAYLLLPIKSCNDVDRVSYRSTKELLQSWLY